MQQFKDWPTALQRKWLLSWAAGAAFLVAGIASYFALEDRPLLVISVLLTACVILRCLFFYRTAAAGNYETITGICIGLGHAGLKRSRTVRMGQNMRWRWTSALPSASGTAISSTFGGLLACLTDRYFRVRLL